jgi:predicted O-methyltransferase YrrM
VYASSDLLCSGTKRNLTMANNTAHSHQVDHEHDPRWTAVDDYTNSHLLTSKHNKYHDALEATLANSRAKGLKNISVFPGQGKLLALQIQLTGAKNVLEVGTLGGYSAIWMASAGPDVKVTTVEVDPETKKVAEENIANAGLSQQITVLLGPGVEILPQLLEEVKAGKAPVYDFGFIDADKINNLNYFNLVIQMIRPNACIYVDNVVRKAQVVDEAYFENDNVRGVRQLIEAVGKDDRVDAVVMQTVGGKNYDGYLLARVKSG